MRAGTEKNATKSSCRRKAALGVKFIDGIGEKGARMVVNNFENHPSGA